MKPDGVQPPLSAFDPESLGRRPRRSPLVLLSVILFASITFVAYPAGFSIRASRPSPGSFYHNVRKPVGICANVSSVSHAGHIGLKGDTNSAPKRSFFWYFEAEENPTDAPIILTMGGGPGTTGLMNTLNGQSPCLASENGLIANPNRWTEKHNLIALDHPIGVGFSYGSHVNSSRAAAYDVYDFLQKFFVLFPQLARNKFIISGGSYGGVYVPNIATVIYEQNLLIKSGKGQPGALPIDLDALIISNPFTSPVAHFRWVLQYRCQEHHVYNATDCERLYSYLPECLDGIETAFQHPTVANRILASKLCFNRMIADTHGIVHEDIRRTCVPDSDSPESCHPNFGWMRKIFADEHVRQELGIPDGVNFTGLNMEVNAEFLGAGDLIQPHHLLYSPLLASGIRLLHYIGMQDANCPWPGIFSFLKLLETPFQGEFVSAPDVPWPTKDVATVRAVGPGAGNMTFILVAEAGHFTVGDQPALAKKIVETWVANLPWF
ncbi:alpha/beta-hydrolase [Mycena rosella]|uniref:Alpha/beta-hydrolase n=1 Tax=Mycena rosella TaxID=1033263 RepID=A0AAD7GFR7_MYCRO|nr:alpha/beta-hydrolase [Mycena rosella]